MKKSILLIGSNGYIGSKIYTALKEDYTFSLVDYCKYEKPLFENTFQINYKSMTQSFVRKHDVVILLAGDSSVALCKHSFKKPFENNVQNFIGLAAKMRISQKFIYASSSSVYGFTNYPVDETHAVVNKHENYDTTKAMIDDAIQRFNLNFYSLRFGTVNGPAPHTRNDIMLNRMVYLAMKNNVIEITNKNIKRPILGINDLCNSITKIIEQENAENGFYNLCSFNSSVGELAEVVSQILNVPILDQGYTKDLPYNFQISNEKFCKNFNFNFTDTAHKIVDNLVKNYNKIAWICRSEKKNN